MLVVMTDDGLNVFRPGERITQTRQARSAVIPFNPVKYDFIRQGCTVPQGMVFAYRFRNSYVFYSAGQSVTSLAHLLTGKLLQNNSKHIEAWAKGGVK